MCVDCGYGSKSSSAIAKEYYQSVVAELRDIWMTIPDNEQKVLSSLMRLVDEYHRDGEPSADWILGVCNLLVMNPETGRK